MGRNKHGIFKFLHLFGGFSGVWGFSIISNGKIKGIWPVVCALARQPELSDQGPENLGSVIWKTFGVIKVYIPKTSNKKLCS